MALGPDDLVLPHFAMIDVEPGMKFIARSFEDRCVAAAAGGFAGIGITHMLYQAEREAGRSDADLVAMARDHGVVVSEIESISMPGPARRDALDEELESVLHAAEVFGANRFFIIAADGVPLDDHVDTFGWVSDECARHGVGVGLEFMNIPGVSSTRDLKSAWTLVERAGRKNGGLCIDTYHYFNGPNDWDDLAAVDGDLVVMIQLSDGHLPRDNDDYIEDTLHNRLPPGEGDFDLRRFVQTMTGLGVNCPYSLEVLNDSLRQLSPAAVGARLGDAGRATLARARG